MRTTLVKVIVASVFTLTLLTSGIGATASAAPSSGHPLLSGTPEVPVCTRFTYIDKPSAGVSTSGSGYTLTVYVEFLYDATTRELCFARSKAAIDKGTNNLVGGTLTLHFSNCSALIDSLNFSVPSGPGKLTYTGTSEGTSCGDTTAKFTASNGIVVPSNGSFLDSGNRIG